MNYFYLYQITNKVNGKIYVGVHKTCEMDDGYMGSGKILKRAIAKHGLENFEKVILETFDNAASMYAREKEVVSDEFLARQDTYNLRRGGHGGFDYINTNELVDVAKRARKGGLAYKAKLETDSVFRQDVIEKQRFGNLVHYRNGRKSTFHDPEFQKEMCRRAVLANTGRKCPGKGQGSKNSQFGTFWITDGTSNSKISDPFTIPEGWHRGRTVNKT